MAPARLDLAVIKRENIYDKNPDIKWNFTKFLVDKTGKVVRRFEPTDDMVTVDLEIGIIM